MTLMSECVCFPGSQSNHKPEEYSGCSFALYHSQHHCAGQTLPEIPRPHPGCPDGGTGQFRSAAEALQLKRKGGNSPEGLGETGKEKKEETEQSQSSELPEKEEKKCPHATAEESRGAAEEEKKQTQKTKK